MRPLPLVPQCALHVGQGTTLIPMDLVMPLPAFFARQGSTRGPMVLTMWLIAASVQWAMARQWVAHVVADARLDDTKTRLGCALIAIQDDTQM